MPVRITAIALVVVGCCLAAAHDGGGGQGSEGADRRAQLADRAQRAYERIVAAQEEPLATTAEEVIDRCIAAMGGREALASLRTLSMTSKGFMVGGQFGAARLLKAPNLIRQERSDGSAVVTSSSTTARWPACFCRT